MVIEKDARLRIVKAIEIDKKIQNFEITERLKGKVVLGCEAYDELRRKFITICGSINSVANSEGKGRDDFTVEILIAAESISRRVSNLQSRAVRKLSERIKESYNNLRILMRQYNENIELIDPQLRNNQELVDALVAFEQSWTKGKEFLLNRRVCGMLIHFSQLIEGVTEKYTHINTKLESMDADLFVYFPCLVVLSSLDGNDKGICKHYYPRLLNPGPEQEEYNRMKDEYESMRRKCVDGYELYNAVERSILDINEVNDEQMRRCKIKLGEIKLLVHGMKKIGMEMQRYKPAEWNCLMETAMGQI